MVYKNDLEDRLNKLRNYAIDTTTFGTTLYILGKKNYDSNDPKNDRIKINKTVNSMIETENPSRGGLAITRDSEGDIIHAGVILGPNDITYRQSFESHVKNVSKIAYLKQFAGINGQTVAFYAPKEDLK